MIILGIETSCDETAAAVLDVMSSRIKVLSNVVLSQVKIHKKYGGIVPEVAARAHVEQINFIIEQSLKKAKIKPNKINYISVVSGPGLITSLMVGVEAAKTLSLVWQKPLLAVNHLEAHVASNFLNNKNKIKFPVLCLVVSGGHTQLVLIKKIGNYQVIGETLDDAAGEAFDKVAKILDLGYPGGPIISKLAHKGKVNAFDLPRPMLNKPNFSFSFSGLKTAVLYTVKKPTHLVKKKVNKDFVRNKKFVYDMCASFQKAVTDVLIGKTVRAAQKYKVKTVMLAGGVSANKKLREDLKKTVKKELPNVNLNYPDLKYTTDNAAMVAMVGYWKAKKKDFTDISEIKVDPNWEI